MKRIIMARRSVSNQKKDLVFSSGKKPATTLGIVSPTIMQKATMPPKALRTVSVSVLRVRRSVCPVSNYLQSPLCDRYGYQARLSIALMHGRLERVCPAHLGIGNDQSDSPVDDQGQSNEKDDACKKASLTESIRLTNDAGTSVAFPLVTLL